MMPGGKRRREHLAGFTLTEISIVLMIVGLVAGGILLGADLVRGYQLRSLVSQVQHYISVTQNFREKYNEYPGDFTGATAFWGAAHATASTCQVTQGTGTQTCNGNGDGKITNDVTISGGIEVLRYWQHLANAGLIDGSYSGVTRTPGSGLNHDAVPGISTPRMALEGATVSVWYVWNSTEGYSGRALADSTEYFTGTYDHIFIVGKQYASADNPVTPLVTPREAYDIDIKIDDGKPATGSVNGYKSTVAYSPGCTTSDVESTAQWSISNTTLLCSFFFRTGF